MRHGLLLFAVLAVFPLLACGSDPKVGDKCEGDAEASCGSDTGLTCQKDFPGTFCTQSCTVEGDTAGCPEDSICARQFSDRLLCSPICSNQDDCRESYSCNGVSNTNVKACLVQVG